jgi:hypothetical protein
MSKKLAIAGVVVGVLAYLYNVNVDVRHTMCLLGSLGYLDILGLGFLDAMTKCMAETSTYYLKRDFKYGEGKIQEIHTFDCSQGFTYEKFIHESKNFTIPVTCKNLLKENKCRSWDFNYFDKISKPDEAFLVQRLDEVEGKRRAFMRHQYPQYTLSKNETFSRMAKGEQLYVSFDNYFVSETPQLIADMDLSQYFGPQKWMLHTLFLSNFTAATLGSPFHAAPNDNFFFQCRGRKHWYYISPQDLHYTSAYIQNGVTFVSNYISEDEIVKRMTIYESHLEEGDMMYNPPFWLHAVGTPPGMTISVANRLFRSIVPIKDNYYFDLMYKIGFPRFISKVGWTKLSAKLGRVSSITIQENFVIPEDQITGGALPVI